jgi:hypothetical protein
MKHPHIADKQANECTYYKGRNTIGVLAVSRKTNQFVMVHMHQPPLNH